MPLPQWMRDGRDPTDTEWAAYCKERWMAGFQRDVEMQREMPVESRDPWEFPRRDV